MKEVQIVFRTTEDHKNLLDELVEIEGASSRQKFLTEYIEILAEVLTGSNLVKPTDLSPRSQEIVDAFHRRTAYLQRRLVEQMKED